MTGVLYDKFEMPEGVLVDDKAATTTHARFLAEPFERGFGHTIGNALRRMMLSAIEAPGIVSFFLEGVPHEYMAVEGIIEDVTHIILNLKGALIRKLPMEGVPYSREMKTIVKMIEVTPEDLVASGQRVIRLGDLSDSLGDFEVINPEHPLFTVTKPMVKRLELKIAMGRGYVSSERHHIYQRVIGEIVLDTLFSPVRLVNYFVEDTRVGQDTDYDRLILDVTTDGRITPKEALSFASRLLTKHMSVFENLESHDVIFHEEIARADTDRDDLMHKLGLGINEIELSVRSTNCLNGANIETIGELVILSEPKLLQFRNFGKKSLNEIKAKLSEMNLSLGMDLAPLGITEENVKDLMKKYREEHHMKGVA